MATKSKPTETSASPRHKRLPMPKRPMFDWRTFDPAMVRQSGPNSLLDEMLTYRDNLNKLVRRHKGKYVLIKGRVIIGIYDERDQALEEAVSRFGSEAVFVKKIAFKEPAITMGGIIY